MKSQPASTKLTSTKRLKSIAMRANVKIILSLGAVLCPLILGGQFNLIAQNNELVGVECAKLNHKHHYHEHHLRHHHHNHHDHDHQQQQLQQLGQQQRDHVHDKDQRGAAQAELLAGRANDNGDRLISDLDDATASRKIVGHDDHVVVYDENDDDYDQQAAASGQYDDNQSENTLGHEMDEVALEAEEASGLPAEEPKLGRRKGYWCHVNCEAATGNQNRVEVCGSNGKIYKTLCDLKREACRQRQVRSIKIATDASACRQLGQSPEVRESETTREQPNRQGGELRIVEMKRRCQLNEYQEMKLELLRQFNGELQTMFEYLDLNSDGYIEAHELWPRRESESSRLLYAQVWSDHLRECPNKRPEEGKATMWQHHHKCWYQLDFAFEPLLPKNPCSLSHLLLFDSPQQQQQHHHHQQRDARFDLDTFREAFRRLMPHQQVNEISGQAQANETIVYNSGVHLRLGESLELSCLQDSEGKSLLETSELVGDAKCLWTRYNLNLASLTRDSHLSVEQSTRAEQPAQQLKLNLKDAQLYLSGQYKCTCHLRQSARKLVHSYTVQISAPPKVSIRPKAQWSLPGSRVSFECQHDYIDTSDLSGQSSKTEEAQTKAASRRQRRGDTPQGEPHNEAIRMLTGEMDERRSPLESASQVDWLKDNAEQIVDSKQFEPSGASGSEDDSSSSLADDIANEDSFYSAETESASIKYAIKRPSVSPVSARSSITMAASRLAIENLKTSDTGSYTCKVRVPLKSDNNNNQTSSSDADIGSSSGSLLVQDQPPESMSEQRSEQTKSLWLFNDNGIRVYSLQNDDGQEMELVKEISGHSLVGSEVDGNWNQLTLCGGLNQEQVVICEWSDNAIYIEVPAGDSGHMGAKRQRTRKYVYVGQPNLNRVLVIDGREYEIVAIINTEPQPRKLFPYKPNKIHLSKWVRRRLSPVANARWLDAMGTLAHPLDETPSNSQLYSIRAPVGSRSRRSHQDDGLGGNHEANKLQLIQHDLWLLCYGQPLVLDPSGDEHLDEIYGLRPFESMELAPKTNRTRRLVQPFTPRLSSGGGRPNSFGWPNIWPQSPSGYSMMSREAQLRNRKSLHIIQSTFFPHLLASETGSGHNHHQHSEEEEAETAAHHRAAKNNSVVSKFKRSTTLTTHHVLGSYESSGPADHQSAGSMFAPSFASQMSPRRARRNLMTRYLGASERELKLRHFQQHQPQHQPPQLDLIQDLYVPMKPYPLMRDLNGDTKSGEQSEHRIHYAYISHYDEARLYRVSMDGYRHDKEIDLQNCDPISLIVTAQGHLVVQCREARQRNLIGQLVLDQVTNSRIEFNANIRAHQAHLSPDHRYLVSVYNDQSSTNETASGAEESSQRRQSIIYVQLVTVSGLRLQYEIKTSLELNQVSFVWKDGYYAAIIASTNRRDQQSEILNLRLADGRLELMARAPGLMSSSSREQLLISPEMKLAAVSTNQGTFVVDLEDNRVSQSIHNQRQTQAPTLLWV